jgi:hypothetical protein
MVEFEFKPGVDTDGREGEWDGKGGDDGDGTTNADEECEGMV